MKLNSKILFFFVFFSTLGNVPVSNAQKVFKILKQADKLAQKGFAKKALKKIEKAEKENDCFCGLCMMQVEEKANLLRYQIHYSKKDYQLARSFIDSIFWFDTKYDSLKILAYQAELGKEYLSKNIDSSLENCTLNCQNDICYVEIPFKEREIPIQLRLDFGKSFGYINGNKLNPQKVINTWLKKFKISSHYKLIKQKS